MKKSVSKAELYLSGKLTFFTFPFYFYKKFQNVKIHNVEGAQKSYYNKTIDFKCRKK